MENGTFQLGDVKKDVADALTKQVTGYTFTCYQTGEAGLRLESSTDANGTWTLTQNEKTHTYAVCPFFADSFCTVGTGQDVTDAKELGKPSVKKQYQIRLREAAPIHQLELFQRRHRQREHQRHGGYL